MVYNNPDFFLSHRLPIALQAKNAGYSVHIAAPKQGRYKEIVNHGLTFHPIAMERSGFHPFRDSLSMIHLFSLFRALKPNVVHNVAMKPMLFGSLAATFAGVPCLVNAVAGLGYVFIGDGLTKRILRAMMVLGFRFLLRHPNQRIIFQNPDDQRTFQSHGIANRAKVTLIRGSGVDLSKFVYVPEPDGIPKVLLVSRMLRDKGVQEFTEASAILKAKGVPVQMILVGDIDTGNPASLSHEQILSWVKKGWVDWLGPRDDIARLMASANIVCLPSYREGLPKVLLEAAACGRAVITTDVPGCRDAIALDETGVLVAVKDSASLADSIERLAMQSDLRADMGRKGRLLAEKEFDIAKVVEKHLEIYRELMTEHR